MTARNPFRVVEKIGRAAGYVLFVILGACVLAPLVIVAARDLGWWALALIPGIPIAFCVLIVLAGICHMAADFIGSRWRGARQRWDVAHREPS